MHALDRKLLRDFRRLWKQALAIAMVLACGVAILLTALGMFQALSDTRASYYERNRFADVFISARRVPLSLLPEIRAIDGVWAVEARITGDAVLDIPGRAESATGRILSLPAVGEPRLNMPKVMAGRLPDPTRLSEVAVNAPFAEANGFVVGDTFFATLNGQRRALTIVGTVLSPEFIYTIGPGALMPNNETFGIIWMPDTAVATAFDLAGAFNAVSLKLTVGAQVAPVKDALDRLLKPFGGLNAYDRSQHPSDAFVDAEISQLRTMAGVLPPIFFGISAFLVSMVMGRIIALERSEIGLLKAIGYSNSEICIHYLMLAGLIAVVGTLIGWGAGTFLARSLAFQYAEFFDFPFLIFGISPWVYAVSGLAALITTSVGAAQSALKAASLAPAVAMQAPAPPRFTRNIIDRVMTKLRFSQPTIMIFRSFLRWPIRSGLTMLGLSLAVATVVAPSFFEGALTKIVDQAFYVSNRQDAMLILARDMPEITLETLRDMPAVLQAEGQLFVPAILRNGPRSKSIRVEARRPDVDLSRVVDTNGQVINATPGGIVLSVTLGHQLGLGIGDTVSVEFLGQGDAVFALRVVGLVEQYFGVAGYMDLEYLNGLFQRGPQINAVNASLDESELDALHSAIKEIPMIAGVVMMTDTRRSFSDTINDSIMQMNMVYIAISVMITIGVAYNGARIQLSERARELASLRILGFTRGEVSYILIGEGMLLAVFAQPLGWAIGAWIAISMSNGFSSDLYRIPIVLEPAIFAKASLAVLTASFISVMMVRRRLDNMDLVAVMKTRE